MGAFLSSGKFVPDLPLIDTKEKFEQRFKDLARPRCFSPEERQWLEIVFTKFGSASESAITWDEATLAQFLGIGLPDNLKSEVDAAGPLIFRSVQRLGSFPWWDRPTGPSLQLHCLGTALIFLICRINLYRHYDTRCISLSPGDMPVRGELLPQNAAPAERDEGSECESSGDDNSEDEDGKFQKRIYIKWYSRLLFQSMSIRPDQNTFPDTPAANASDPSSKEELGDIDYLSQAYSIVSRGNFKRHPNNPKIGARGPPIIPKSELPPSNYWDVSGSIPVEQFQAFFKLLVAALHHRRRDLEGDIFGDEIELDEVESRIERLDQVVADALKSSNESVENRGISWSQFETITSTEMPTILFSLYHLFVPFIKVEGLSSEDIERATKSEAADLIRKTLAPYF